MRPFLVLLCTVNVLFAQVRELWRAGLEDSVVAPLTNHVLGDAEVGGKADLIIAGKCNGAANETLAGFVAKIDSRGNVVWKVTEPLPVYGAFGSLDVDSAGNSFVGFSLSVDTLSRTADALLIKLSPEGRELWRLVQSGVANGPNASLFKVDEDGSVFLASLLARGESSSDLVTEWEVSKINSTGKVLWRVVLPNVGYLLASDSRASRMLSFTDHGDLLLVGTYAANPFPSPSTRTSTSGFAAQVSSKGNVQWWTTDYKGNIAPYGFASVGVDRTGRVCASGSGSGLTVFSKSGKALYTSDLGGIVVGPTFDGDFLLRTASYLYTLRAMGGKVAWGIQPMGTVWDVLPNYANRWLAVGSQPQSPRQFQFASISRKGTIEWRIDLPNNPFTQPFGAYTDIGRPLILRAPDGTMRVIGQAPYDNRIAKPGIVAVSFAITH